MEYREALERAVLYVENHMEENFTAADVACAAGYSYYHLTRVFHALLGEGIGSYIQKRRLAGAAQKLLYTNDRVLDIALAHGFDSGEAFSRAFKATYSVTPWNYRKNRVDTFVSYKHRMDLPRLEHILNNVTVHPQIVEVPDFLVAGMRGKTTLRDNTLPDLWQRFNTVAHMVPNPAPGARGIGVCESCTTGNTLYGMSDDIPFTEVAGIEVTSLNDLPAPFVGKQVKGGRYAVFTHKGSITRLPQTFEYIWGTWFLVTSEELDSREDFELYDGRFYGLDNPDSEMDIYIPIK